MARYKPNSKEFEELKELMRTGINPRLVEKQNVTEDGIDRIAQLHAHRHMITESMEDLDPEKDLVELRRRAAQIEDIEFKLQHEWGFPEDKHWHTWWHTVPHCLCPSMDNMERVGTPYNIVNCACPIHGGE